GDPLLATMDACRMIEAPSGRRRSAIREDDVELALLAPDLCEETIEIAEVRRVSLYAGHIYSDLLDRRSQLRITAPRDEDVRAFVHELLRRRQANAAVASSDERDFPFKLPYEFLPTCPCSSCIAR